ncbi:MAG TPA: aminoglycoside phosphotransferase family protein [Micromonosporaceae bacterium]
MTAPGSEAFVEAALLRFGVVADRSGPEFESRSGAGVHPVRTSAGSTAFLKVTPAGLGTGAIDGACRELRFYTDIAHLAPVRTPRLLDWVRLDEGVALLLEAAGRPVPVERWTAEMWSALGRDLAALHAMDVPAASRRPAPDPLGSALADPDLDVIRAFWQPVLPNLDDLLARLAHLERDLDALPAALVHGDCHTDNIVHRSGRQVFCDWQVTGVGRPASDLAMLRVRATPAGVDVPDALLDAYSASAGHPRRAVERAVLAAEVAIFVLQWPPFAAYNTPAGIDRVHRRTRSIADGWLSDVTRIGFGGKYPV